MKHAKYNRKTGKVTYPKLSRMQKLVLDLLLWFASTRTPVTVHCTHTGWSACMLSGTLKVHRSGPNSCVIGNPDNPLFSVSVSDGTRSGTAQLYASEVRNIEWSGFEDDNGQMHSVWIISI